MSAFSDGHHIGWRVERESVSFDVLERNVPLSARNTSRSGSQGEELDTILPTQPMDATHSDGVWAAPIVVAVTVTEILVQLLHRVQRFPTPTVRCEGEAAIGNRCIDPWVALQSNRKQVDFVLN